MALPASGPLSLDEIAAEMGVVGGDYSLTDLSETVNPAASPRPDGVPPHAISEFYGYTHASLVSPTPTPTVTPSITPSITPSRTPSASVGAGPSVTPSVTGSPSVTPSITPSVTRTPSVTPTPSASPCSASYVVTLWDVVDTFCSEMTNETNYYATSSPLEIGTRVYTGANCSGINDGHFSDGASVYDIVGGIVTTKEGCTT